MVSLAIAGSVFVLLGMLMFIRNKAMAAVLCRMGRNLFGRQRGFAVLRNGIFEPGNASGAIRFLGVVFLLQGMVFIVLGIFA